VVDVLLVLNIAVALAVGLFGVVTAALGRAPDVWHRYAVIGLGGLLVVLAAAVLGEVVDGVRPGAVFWGYLVSTLLVPPAGWTLAKLEPTRWGSAIVGAVGLVVAPLVLRLSQLWGGA